MIDYNKLLSKRVQNIKPSGIRKYFDIANEMEDCIVLGVGEPDFKTPWAIREAGIKSLEKGRTWYSSNAGLAELRKEICNYTKRKLNVEYSPINETLVTVGGSEAIDLCIRAVVNDGDEVIIPEPCYVSYSPITDITGAVSVPIPLKAENNFKLTAKELIDAITPKTKLLILPFPCNPTGAVMEKEDLEQIANVIRNTDILILTDEIYSELTYTGKRHYSIIELDGMKERTILINGFSKAFAMTGWRLGYAQGPKEIITMMTKIHQFALMCAPSTSQYAAIVALRDCDDEITNMRDEYNMRRKLLLQRLKDMNLECFDCQGAFYLFPCIKKTGLTSEEFCDRLLLEKKVAVIPGNAFGDSGEGYIRISYSYSIKHLQEGLNRIEQFLIQLENEKNG